VPAGAVDLASRNAYQLGTNGSINSDPFFIGLAWLLLALLGLRELGVLPSGRWLLRTPLLATVYAALVVLRSWLAPWHVPNFVTVQRGLGGWVAVLGLVCAVVAVVVGLRSTSRAAAAPSQDQGWPPPTHPSPPPIVS
jgi:hypothetical protein